MSGSAPEEPPLLRPMRPDPTAPVLVSGQRAVGIASAAGEMALLREARGGPVEWGGVYGEGIRLTGPWTVRLVRNGTEVPLASTTQETRVYRHGFASLHALPGLEFRQTITAVEEDADLPGIGRRLELTSTAPEPLALRVETSFSPFLMPVLVEGIKPYDYHVATHGRDLWVTSHGFGLSLHSDPLPHHFYLDRASWIGGRVNREVREIAADYDLVLPPGGTASVTWLVTGGLERTLDRAAAGGEAALACASGWEESAHRRFDDWVERTPVLELPGLPEIEEGYRLARGALRQLYTAGDPDLYGLAAGYPWYASIWGRDLAWMLPAVLWLGDVDRVERSLRTMFRYQSPSHLPILGAAAGEIPMQLTAGPIFLFGTSDTTLHYPALVGRLVDFTGQAGPLAEFGEALDRAEAWAQAKVDPESGLLRNGGEVAEIRSASDEAGPVHYGFDAVDTTIWDSTDRRDHAIDVQVLHLEMLRTLSRLAPLRGRPSAAAELGGQADRLANAIASRFDWPEEGYLFDSLARDGRAVRRVRPNALRAVSAGLVDPGRARAAVARVSRDDLTTPWGVRTLSSADPGYDPVAYHDGQVWPIATAWAADAALAAGERDLGLRYLGTLARMLQTEGGLANECYRGDRAEPFDSCFLLGFSVGPFLTVLFERLWGIRPHLLERRVTVEPALPPAGRPARLGNLTLGGGALDLELSGGRLTACWRGPGRISLDSDGVSVDLDPGVPATLEVAPAKRS